MKKVIIKFIVENYEYLVFFFKSFGTLIILNAILRSNFFFEKPISEIQWYLVISLVMTLLYKFVFVILDFAKPSKRS